MKLHFRERIFTWFDSYDVHDENHKLVYRVKGQLSWGHKLVIFNAKGERVGVVTQKIVTLLPKYEIEAKGESLGFIKKNLTLINPHYDFDKLGWHAKGNFVKWNYKIVDDKGDIVAKIDKKLIHLTDNYVIDVPEKKNALKALMFVIAIDAEQCAQEKRENKG